MICKLKTLALFLIGTLFNFIVSALKYPTQTIQAVEHSYGIAFHKNHIFLGSDNLYCFDLRKKKMKTFEGVTGFLLDILIEGDYAYIGDNVGFQYVDLKKKELLKRFSFGPDCGFAFRVLKKEPLVYIADSDGNSIRIFDPNEQKVIKIVQVDKFPSDLAFYKDQLLVVCASDHKLISLDGQNFESKKEIELDSEPFCIEQWDGKAYISDSLSSKLWVVDLESWSVKSTVPLIGRPSFMAMSDGLLYVVLDNKSKIVIIDTKNNSTLQEVSVVSSPTRIKMNDGMVYVSSLSCKDITLFPVYPTYATIEKAIEQDYLIRYFSDVVLSDDQKLTLCKKVHQVQAIRDQIEKKIQDLSEFTLSTKFSAALYSLPIEILRNIVSFLDVKSLASIDQASHLFHTLCADKNLKLHYGKYLDLVRLVIKSESTSDQVYQRLIELVDLGYPEAIKIATQLSEKIEISAQNI